MAIYHLDLFAGIGTLGLALRAVIPKLRTVAYVERESYPAGTLVRRMVDSSLDSAPIWDDVTTFDGRPWCGVVDIISAGFPCQPFSLAGLHRGMGDERFLFDDVTRIANETQCPLLFLENVPGLLSNDEGEGFKYILQELAKIGFDAEWTVATASSFGASHRRERLFILAYSSRERLESLCNNTDIRCPPATSVRLFEDRTSYNNQPYTRYFLPRRVHGTPARMERIRALGNAVVPVVGAAAFRTLMLRALGKD